MIQDPIAAQHGDLTIVMIGHRLPMLQLADQVIILSEGRIVRAGKGSEIALEQP
jgi:ATP-binding cassette subfamily C protein